MLNFVYSLHFREGKSRRFGFVGYASLDAAKEARSYFDNTYLHTSKMGIEYAQPVCYRPLVVVAVFCVRKTYLLIFRFLTVW
jgi:RNA recognition motif-containing protein